MQFNLYIFNQLFRTCMALITVLISIIWLFQSIRLLEFVVDKGASVGEFFLMSVTAMPLRLVFEYGLEGIVQLTGEPALTGLSGRRTTTSRSVGFPSSSTS